MQRIIPLILLFNLTMMPTTRPWISCFQVFLEMNLIEFVILKLLTRYGLAFKAFMKELMPSRQGFLRPIAVSMKISFNFLASVETLFSRFQSCVNKMRDNIIKMPYEDHDLALKLLHALDRSVWGVKVDAIIES